MVFFLRLVTRKCHRMFFSRRSRLEPARIVQWAIVAVFILAGAKLVQISAPRINPVVDRINGNDQDVSQLEKSLDLDAHDTHSAYKHDILDIPRASSTNQLPWSVSYSPLTSQGSCKLISKITEDFKQITQLGIHRVRLASMDCNVLESLMQVPSLHAILGLYVDSIQGSKPSADSAKRPPKDSVEYLREIYDQLHELIDSGVDLDEQIDMLVVGSDAGLHNNRYTRRELVRMLKFVRLSLPEYQGLITTSEPIESYISPTRYNAPNAEHYYQTVDEEDLCSAIDVIGLISQPFFNTAIEAGHADALIERDVEFGHYLCSDQFIGSAHITESDDTPAINSPKPVVVLESGWPSSGTPNGNAIASVENQAIAVNRLIRATDSQGKIIPINIHSFDDEKWREPGILDAETSFGISRMFI